MSIESGEVFKQGAEGRLFIGEYKGERCLIKERFPKKYRHPDLDAQISRQRMKAEMKAAARCLSAGILAPRMLHMDLNERRIYMEYFENAVTAKDYIRNTVANAHKKTKIPSKAEQFIREKLEALCDRIGSLIGKMHANNIIHGDLTTSNILIDDITTEANINTFNNIDHAEQNKISAGQDYKVIFVDFGLSHYNQGAEDKGVDLYVLERAVLSTHSEQPYLFDKILEAYRRTCGSDEDAVVAKFEEVRARGRKRTMIG